MKVPFFIVAFSFVFVFALTKNASANLVQDGDFTQVTSTYTGPLTMSGTLYGQFGTDVTGPPASPASGSTLTVANWSTDGYNFVYAPGTADAGTSTNGASAGNPQQVPGESNVTTGPNSGYGNTFMYGSNNNAGSPVLPLTDPAGGNFIAMDGTYQRAAVTQTITGLTVGQTYILKFYFAGAQQQGYTGTTTDTVIVSLGATSGTTQTLTVNQGSFSGWNLETFAFKASGTSELLSFVADGTPNGQPPFSLIGGVDLEVVPDFSNWMVFAGFGIACITFEVVRRRRQRRQSDFGVDSGTALTKSFPGVA